MLGEEEIDVACVSETHLKDNIVAQQTHIKGYNCVRKDRQSHMGGLITYINQNLKFSECNLGQTALLEYSALLICNVTPKTMIINVYLPGGATRSEIKDNLNEDMNRLLKAITPGVGVVLMGDLNAKHKAWNNTKNNAAGTIVLKFVERNNYTISYPEDPTYCPNSIHKANSTIDLALSNNLISSSRPFTQNILTSDHVPVFIKLHCEINGDKSKKLKIQYNLSRTNWRVFRESLNNTILNDLRNTLEKSDSLTSPNLIDSAIETLTTATLTAIEQSTPKGRNDGKGTVLSLEVKALIKSRNYFKRRWVRHHREEDNENYKELVRLINHKMTEERNLKFRKLLENCRTGDNKIHKLIRNRRRSEIPALKDAKLNCRRFNADEKAEMLAEHFRSMHINPLEKNNLIFTRGVEAAVGSFTTQSHAAISISSAEVVRTIKSLKNGKSPGPDLITTHMIKNYSYWGYEILTNIYNACLTHAYFPTKWKTAITVAVPKSGKDPKLVSSYRPIALLCIFGKVLEKLIASWCVELLRSKEILPDHQFGFRKGLSTGHAIDYLYATIKRGLKNKESTGAVSFDIEKAFDRVWHNGLLFKMIRMGFPVEFIKIVQSFLRPRSFCVRVGEGMSKKNTISWGVPQGSVLSPTLYNIYISDIPMPNSDETRIIQYADDTIVLTTNRQISNIEKELQTYSKMISDYYTLWKIKINQSKTELTLFTKRKTKQLPTGPLEVLGNKTVWADKMKYLGVILDKKLTLAPQAQRACAKTDATIRLLYPYICRSSTLDDATKVHIYKTYILPLLTYSIPLTAKMNKTRIKELEVKQCKCLRMLQDVSWEDLMSNVRVRKRANTESILDRVGRLFASYTKKCKTSVNALIARLYQDEVH